MDSRTKKSRSLAIDEKSPTGKRPGLGDRHNSAPAVKPRRESQTKRVSASTKPSDSSRRTSKPSQKDDGKSRAPGQRYSEPPRIDSRSKTSPAKEGDEMITLSFAILGASGVGKTCFARNALDQRKMPESPLVASKVSLAKQLYRVQLFELGFDDIDFAGGNRIAWPKSVRGVAVPAFQGVFCLYDVTEASSKDNVPPVLAALSMSDIPCILVACKADASPDVREISPRFHDHLKRSFSSILVQETSKREPETHKRCLSNLLQRVLERNTVGHKSVDARARSQSEATTLPPHLNSRNSSPSKSRSRSRSHSRLRISKSRDLILNVASRPPIIESGDEGGEDENELAEESDSGSDLEMPKTSKAKLKVDTSNVPRPQSRPMEPHTPVSDDEMSSSQQYDPSANSQGVIPETPESYYVKSMLRPSSSELADRSGVQTFLNMDEESHDDANAAAEGTTQAMQNLTVEESASGDTGVCFYDLVERLLTLPSSRHDSKFVPSFLCLYRLFATPRQLLVAVIDHFVKTEKGDLARFAKVAEMLRYLQVLGQWTANYPGDFASSQVRDIATTFVQSLEKHREFSHAAREISNNLTTQTPDDDLDWAYDDAPSSASSKDSSSSHKKTPTSSSTSIPSSITDGSRSTSEGDERSGTTVSPSVSQVLRGNSSQTLLNIAALQEARQQASRLRPNPTIKLSKIQWRQFMETPIEDLAREITRIDWTMYSSIRPRDYVRHVTLSEKRRPRKNDNITVMVRQFNHLAIFVSGMVLLRDKPKHRAKAIEKFMQLAWKVRQMSNYNSLGAIVAGITGHEISRLAATHQLVPDDTRRQFMRLTILMGISRSYGAYRMAWENSNHERIPFIPLLRQDLTMSAAANQTFIGSNINWKKFEIMGEAIVGVQRSLEQHYTFPPRTIRSEETARLILETKILGESDDSADPRAELYERSVQVEPTNQSASTDSRARRLWMGR